MEWIIKEIVQKYDFCDAAEFLGLKDEIQECESQECKSREQTRNNPKTKHKRPKSDYDM